MTKIMENKEDFLRLVEMIEIGKQMIDARSMVDKATMITPDIHVLITQSRKQMLSLQMEIKGIRERLSYQGNSVARLMTQLAIEVSFIVSLSQKACDRALPIAEKSMAEINKKTGWLSHEDYRA